MERISNSDRLRFAEVGRRDLLVVKKYFSGSDRYANKYIDIDTYFKEAAQDTNDYLNSASLNGGTGILTLGVSNQQDVTVDLSSLGGTDTNDFLSSASLNPTNNVLTLGVNNQANVTVDLSGLLSVDTQTLQEVFDYTQTEGVANVVTAALNDPLKGTLSLNDGVSFLSGSDGSYLSTTGNNAFGIQYSGTWYGGLTPSALADITPFTAAAGSFIFDTNDDNKPKYFDGTVWDYFGIQEAPVDNAYYVRRNAAWEPFVPGAGNFTEADVITTERLYEAGQALSTVTIASVTNSVDYDLAAGNSFALTLTENATLQAPTWNGGAFPPKHAQSYEIEVEQNGTGGWTLTLPSQAYKWHKGIVPDFPITAGQKFLLTCSKRPSGDIYVSLLDPNP